MNSTTAAPDMLELMDDYDARASHFAADKGFVDILELLYAEVRKLVKKDVTIHLNICVFLKI